MNTNDFFIKDKQIIFDTDNRYGIIISNINNSHSYIIWENKKLHCINRYSDYYYHLYKCIVDDIDDSKKEILNNLYDEYHNIYTFNIGDIIEFKFDLTEYHAAYRSQICLYLGKNKFGYFTENNNIQEFKIETDYEYMYLFKKYTGCSQLSSTLNQIYDIYSKNYFYSM